MHAVAIVDVGIAFDDRSLNFEVVDISVRKRLICRNWPPTASVKRSAGAPPLRGTAPAFMVFWLVTMFRDREILDFLDVCRLDDQKRHFLMVSRNG